MCLCLFSLFILSANAETYNSSCYSDMGIIYSNTTFPQSSASRNDNTSSNIDISKLKKGEASMHNIFSLIELGDAGIDTAAKNADIKKISYIDVNERMVFIFWRKVTVNVYGE